MCAYIIIYINIIDIDISIFPAIDTTNASSYREVYLLRNSATLEFLGQFGRIPTNSSGSGHSSYVNQKTILKLCAPGSEKKNLRDFAASTSNCVFTSMSREKTGGFLKKDMVDISMPSERHISGSSRRKSWWGLQSLMHLQLKLFQPGQIVDFTQRFFTKGVVSVETFRHQKPMVLHKTQPSRYGGCWIGILRSMSHEQDAWKGECVRSISKLRPRFPSLVSNVQPLDAKLVS